MIEAIQGLTSAEGVIGALAGVPAAAPAPTAHFDIDMVAAIGQVETQHTQADSALADLAAGENVDLHGTMIELEKADIALRTMVSVRDRFISAYEQVMNMTV